jgi:hypothetical protein
MDIFEFRLDQRACFRYVNKDNIFALSCLCRWIQHKREKFCLVINLTFGKYLKKIIFITLPMPSDGERLRAGNVLFIYIFLF